MSPAASARLRREIGAAFARQDGQLAAGLYVKPPGRWRMSAHAKRPPANQARDEAHGEEDRQGSQQNTTDDAHAA
jgi:hypothetical protein